MNQPADESPPNAPALDIEQPGALQDYLRAAGRIAPDESPVIRRLAGGVSNRTVRVDRAGGESWVVKQALAKLRVQVDWFSDPARIHREADGLRWLAKLAPAGSTPQLIFEDREFHLLAMEAVPEPHANWKSLLLESGPEADHVAQFAELLAIIHAEGFREREAVRPVFADRTFFESLRLEPYFAYAAERVPAAREFLAKLIADTRGRLRTLVHGDYSPKNVLIHGGRLTLLDHEVIHWGDPAFDVGFSLTHLLSKAHHRPERRRDFADAARAHWAIYLQRVVGEPWADELESFSVRHTLGCLLARVAGRSPLEYLTEAARARQLAAVTTLTAERIDGIENLIDRFVHAIEIE